jgi:predicted dehydrogenase
LPDIFQVVAFCDTSEERRVAAAREFPGATVVADYHDLLKLDEVDAVLVLTPIALNAPVALAALRAGKDVIMEKPIARSVAEGQELVETARRLGKRLFVTEQLAYRRIEDRVAALLAGGEIGKLILWNRVQHVDADPAQGDLRFETTPWRKKPDYPLGAMFDGGIHLIASLNRIFGAPAAVYATGRRLRPEYGEYDHITTMFHYADGATGVLSHATVLSPLQNHFHIHGSAGAIVVEEERLVVEKQGQPAEIIEAPPENARVTMWQALAAAFQENCEPYYTAEKALRDVAILTKLDQAIKGGMRISI